MVRFLTPGSDIGTWGEILNEYLSQSLSLDGTLKADAIGSAQLRANSVTATALSPGPVTRRQSELLFNQCPSVGL